MASVSYLPVGTRITPGAMNALFGVLHQKMNAVLGGRSFLVVNKDFSFTEISGRRYYPNVPYDMVGKTFFFGTGPTAYSQYVPGAIRKSYTVSDPVAGGTDTADGVRPYDHAPFTDAAAAAVLLAQDDTKHIALIEAVDGAYYTDGLEQFDGVSLFDQSLEAHREGSTGYWIREEDCPVPEKIYVDGLAEIIIEGTAAVDLQVCALDRFKYECIRLHNLQMQSCTVTLPDGADVSLGPLECQSYRLNVARTAFVVSPYRWFFEYRNDDYRGFWFWNQVPQAGGGSLVSGAVGVALNGASADAFQRLPVLSPQFSAQGNNLSNAAVLYDVILHLTDDAGTHRHAAFNRDVHELCNQAALYAPGGAVIDTPLQAGKFAALEPDGSLKADAVIGDLFHHTGALRMMKISNSVEDPRYPGSGLMLVESETISFNGHAALTADLAAKNITAGVDGSGNLTVESTETDWSVDLISMGSNLLKNVDILGATHWFHVAPGVTVRNGTPYTCESKVLENGGANGQDFLGNGVFALATQSNYRITQRSVSVTANERTYVDENGDTITVTGTPHSVLADVALVTARTMSAIHTRPVSELLDLSFFGNPALGSQDDDYVQYVGTDGSTESRPTFTLTPEGWVLTFKERVRADILPNFALGSNSTWYANYAGNRFGLEEIEGVFYFTFKHAIRFRRHGFGWGEQGKRYAAFLPPHDGRYYDIVGFESEVSGVDGADYYMAKQRAQESAVKLLRSIDLQWDLTSTVPGQRFRKIVGGWLLDSLLQFENNYIAKSDADAWWANHRFQVILGFVGLNVDRQLFFDHANHAVTTQEAMPLSIEHYNAMAQMVNQGTTGRALDWRAMRFVVGATVLDLNGTPGLVPWSHGDAFGSAPAPLDAFLALVPDDDDLDDYWEYLFGELGLDIRTKAGGDLPDNWDDFKNEWNEERSVQTTYRLAIDNVVFGGSRNIWEDNAGSVQEWYYSIYSGDFAAEMDPLALGSATQVSQGSALLAIPAADALPANSTPGPTYVNLRTAYDSRRWILTIDFKEWCESIGFPFLFAEAIQPLVLDWFELPAALEDTGLSALSYNYNGEVASADTPRLASDPPPDGTTGDNPANLAFLNALADLSTPVTVATMQVPDNSASTYRTKQIAFRLADEEDVDDDPGGEESLLWKVAVSTAAPPTVYRRGEHDRTPGTFRFGFYALFGFGTSSTGDDWVLNLNGTDLQASAPWYPADLTDMVPKQPAQGTFGDPWPGHTSGTVQIIRGDGPRAFYQFETDPRAVVENYYRWLGREQDWCAFRIVASAGVTAVQEVYALDRPHWAVALDWWDASPDVYLAQVQGLATAVPEELAGSGAEILQCGAGLTLVFPEQEKARLLVWDPVRLRVGL